MYTIGKYSEELQELIKQGKVFKDRGGVLFEKEIDAFKYGIDIFGENQFEIYSLEKCNPNEYINNPIDNHPLKK